MFHRVKSSDFLTRLSVAVADRRERTVTFAIIFTIVLTLSQGFYRLKEQLQPLYDEREATAMAHEVVGHITDLDRSQRLIQKDTPFSDAQLRDYERMVRELQTGRPLQYVIGKAWFMGRPFYVNDNVLIPRPETEELVDWITRDCGMDNTLRFLDIGTGSGCIPVSLKLAMPAATVSACDISREALVVAQKNAGSLGAIVEFIQADFLDGELRNKLGMYDVIVSNPPYIPAEEKSQLHKNVRDFEPGIALFVPDNDALVFYKAIADFGKSHVPAGGVVYCELDAGHAQECAALFAEVGYKDVEIRKDMHGNWRMLKAVR